MMMPRSGHFLIVFFHCDTVCYNYKKRPIYKKVYFVRIRVQKIAKIRCEILYHKRTFLVQLPKIGVGNTRMLRIPQKTGKNKKTKKMKKM